LIVLEGLLLEVLLLLLLPLLLCCAVLLLLCGAQHLSTRPPGVMASQSAELTMLLPIPAAAAAADPGLGVRRRQPALDRSS
jgi:hypothetical protein